jgi:hypothetical protein
VISSNVIGGREVGKFGGVSRTVLGWGGGFCGGAEFGANYVGGKAGAEEIAIEGRASFFVKRTFDLAQAAFEARTDKRCFVRFGENGFERGFDVAVREAAGAEFADDSEFALVTVLRMDARIVAGVTRVVEVLELFQLLDHFADVVFVFGAAGEVFAHFVYGI